jgi:ribosome-binding factor A
MNKKNPKIKSAGKSQRQLQIGEQIKRIIAEIFLQDNVLTIKNGYLTILQADISPDAKNAKIFIDIFGEADRKKILQDLKQIAPYLRSKLANKINLRYTPELTFVLDETAKEGSKIEDLLKQEAKKFK